MSESRKLRSDTVAVAVERPPYQPPCAVVLRGLGITTLDLERQKVTVSTDYLLFLLSKIAGRATVDEQFYRKRYPDVEAAILAQKIPSYQAHFERSGYREGRLPHNIAYNPDWYFSTYRDLANVFEPGTEAVAEHFEAVGYYEGRVGVPEDFEVAESWRLGRNGA